MRKGSGNGWVDKDGYIRLLSAVTPGQRLSDLIIQYLKEPDKLSEIMPMIEMAEAKDS
jgi:hypothetical protein